MRWNTVKRPLVLGAIGFLLPLGLSCQDVNAGKERALKIAAVNGQPALVLGIWAEGRFGKVEVRNEKGGAVQSLACALLRESVAPAEPELAAVREQFVRGFESRDLNFDGYADLTGIREFGAKWARYCVWLYDPRQHLFVKDFLAEQVELLTNLGVESEHRISASSIGPANPWSAVYGISNSEGGPPRQLVPFYSCLVETNVGGSKPVAFVITHYDHGEAAVQRRDAGQMDTGTAMDKCTAMGKEDSHPSPQKK